MKHDRELFVLHTRRRTAPETPLLDHHTPFLLDFFALEEYPPGPVLQDLEGSRKDFGIVHRRLQHVDGLVETRIGIDVGAELHADRLQIIDQLLFFEVFGAVERHVLNEMRQSELILVFDDRPHIHDQTQFRTVLRSVVLLHEVAQPVVKLADHDRGIRGNRVLGRPGLRNGRRSGEKSNKAGAQSSRYLETQDMHHNYSAAAGGSVRKLSAAAATES